MTPFNIPNTIPNINNPLYKGFLHNNTCTNTKCNCSKDIINQKFISLLAKYLKEKYPKTFCFVTKKQKYSPEELITSLLFMTESGLSYRQMEKIQIKNLNTTLPRSTLYYHFNKFKNNNIFGLFYNFLLYEYFNSSKAEKLKYQSIDSSFIYNKCGLSDQVARNKYAKNKNCLKISVIIDDNKVPISIIVDKGNKHDSVLFEDNINNFLYDPNTLKYKKCHRYKQYFLADSGYDSKKINEILENKGYIPIICKNKRNNHQKINKFENNYYKNIYKRRIKVENLFSTIKFAKKLSFMYEKTIKAYKELLFLYLCKNLYKVTYKYHL